MPDKAAEDTLDPPLDPISKDEGYEDLDEREEIIPQHYGISSYGADFPVDGLVKRMDNGDIVVPTFDPGVGDDDLGVVGFQRDFVWSKSQADRFIESLCSDSPCRNFLGSRFGECLPCSRWSTAPKDASVLL